MLDLIEVGQQIRTARKSLAWTQAELVKRSGVSRARIDALENGRAPEFGVKHLSRLLNALGLDLRITTLNNGRPTLDDLREEAANAPRMGR
jgi:transcriptional regulator with XRE-family HTH domain